MKLLMDSCIPKYVAEELSKKGNSVDHVNDVMSPDSTDEVVYAHAKKSNAVLVTSNYKDFESTGKFTLSKHPGAIVLKAKNPISFGHLLELIFFHFKRKSDYSEKRVLLNESKFTIIHKNGRKTEFKKTDIESQMYKKNLGRPRK